MLLVYCQIQVKQSKKKRGGAGGGCKNRKEKEKTHARKSNECVLLTEIPGARLRGSDGGKSCSFR